MSDANSSRHASAPISKGATATQLGRNHGPHMHGCGVLIDHRSRLSAAVAIADVEIEGSDAMLAEGAFERGAAVQRFGRVISHISIVVLFLVARLGIRC